MRQIGHLEKETLARTFGDFLYVQGIENQVEQDSSDGWAIWIHDEEKLDRATELLAEFRANPKDEKFSTRAQDAAKLREKEQLALAAYEKKIQNRRHLFRPLTGYGFGLVTFLLICVCVVVFVISKFGKDLDKITPLFISVADVALRDGNRLQGLPEIRHGEIWRLLTPIFIHFSPLHIFFNMLWLRDLGSMIEDRQNSGIFCMLVVVIGIASNFGQYLATGPIFGGMSGVVYGLLGYIWMRGKFDPGSGLFVHPATVWMMIVWFFFCLSGYIGGIANIAHGVGLITGMAWGYLSALRYR